jgi:hypothetical protein
MNKKKRLLQNNNTNLTPTLIDATLYEVKENKDEEGTVYTGKRKSNRVTFI